MKPYFVYNDKILLNKEENQTYVYDIKNRKFFVSLKDITEVLDWLKNTEKEQDKKAIIEEQLSHIKKRVSAYKMSMLIFNSAEMCNLQCKYCFANAGTYNNHEEKRLMTFKDYVSAYNLYNKNDEIKAIEFFGGEPLLNFTEIKSFCYFIKKEQEIKKQEMPRLGIITNGTLLNKAIWEFLKEFNFNITISIDGPRAINDENRCYKDGSGSFENVMKSLDWSEQEGKYLFDACEATLTCEILMRMDSAEMLEYIKFFEKLPCKTIGIFFAIDQKADLYSQNEIVLSKLELFYEIYAEHCLNGILDENLTKYHSDIINAIKAFIFGGEVSFCGAGISQLFVSVKGEVYPCQRYYMIGDKMGFISNVTEICSRINEIKNNFYMRINEECLVCEFRDMCEGAACPGNNLAINGAENKYISLMCQINKIRNMKVLTKLFDIIIDQNLNGKFIKCWINYIKKIGVAADEKGIFI